MIDFEEISTDSHTRMFPKWHLHQPRPARDKLLKKRKGKSFVRGVWAPMLIKGGSSLKIYDDPSTEMFVHEWLSREDDDCLKFNRHYVGDRYKLKECSSGDTITTMPSSSDDEDEKTIELSIRQRAKALPRGPGAFGGCHILINKERVKRGIKPLCREKKLDEVAAAHAKKMAVTGHLQHSSLRITMANILDSGPCRLIGENISKGRTASVIHGNMMSQSAEDRNNMLDRRYTAFGVGSAKSSSGELYLVQIYRG